MNPVRTIKLKFPRDLLPTTGLVLDYGFNSGEAVDLSGNDNDGTVTGATATATDTGAGLEFDGVDDEVDAGAIADLFAAAGEAWTLSVRVNPISGYIFDNGNVAIERLGAGFYDIRLRGRSNPVYLDSDAWANWILRWDGSQASAYIDGDQLTERTDATLLDDGGTQILDDSGTAVDPSYEWYGR